MSEDVRLTISRRQRSHHEGTESLWSLRARRLTRLGIDTSWAMLRRDMHAADIRPPLRYS
jgi:hypothetical protein